MATLKKQDKVGVGLKQIACAQVEAGVRALTRQADQADVAVQAIHEATAVLALLEPELPRATVRRDRALAERLRDGLDELARPAVILAGLKERYKKTPTDPALAAAVKALRKRCAAPSGVGTAMNSSRGNFNPAVYRLVADMAELRGHAGEWPVDQVDDAKLPAGLRRTYTRARRLAAQASDTQHFAELAEALKTLATQLGVLSKPCPPMVKAHRKLFNKAAESLQLGLDELTVDQALREQIASKPDKPAKGALARPKTNAAPSDELRAAFAESPAAFFNRMQVYWSAWRDGPSD